MSKTMAEKQMLAVTAKAKKNVYETYKDEDTVLDIIPSWVGRDLILDVKLEEDGWVRLQYLIEDDSEVSAFGRLK